MSKFSSRCCERGTKACNVQHKEQSHSGGEAVTLLDTAHFYVNRGVYAYHAGNKFYLSNPDQSARIAELESYLDTYKRLAATCASQVKDLAEKVHNLNWALGTEGYETMATPAQQSEANNAEKQSDEILLRLKQKKTLFDKLVEALTASDELLRSLENSGGFTGLAIMDNNQRLLNSLTSFKII